MSSARVSFIVGLAVSGLTIYAATVEKARECEIIRAVGFKNSYPLPDCVRAGYCYGALGFRDRHVITVISGPLASK